MATKDFSATLTVEQEPEVAFNAINNVRGWWSDSLEGNSENLNDEFTYRYRDIHYSKQKLVEVIPGKRVVWEVLDSSLNFIKEKDEWTGTKISFDISRENNKTQIKFTHLGLVPDVECFDACSKGWSFYLKESLLDLITKGKGNPNHENKKKTTAEVAARFNELAQQEKWFQIQDELFADDVKSIEPAHSTFLPTVQGKDNVRKKGEDWVKRVEARHNSHTTQPVVGGNYFAVGRETDITVQGIGRIEPRQIMLYEVKDGKIVSEQFFY